MSENNGLMLTVFVTTPAKKQFCFRFLAVQADKAEDLLIEEEFYLENSVLPEFPHFEIIWCKGGLYNGMLLEDMHLHKSKKVGNYHNSRFLCFTGRIANLDHVGEILFTWCVGTAYRFETGEDMNDAIKRFDGNIEQFVKDCQDKGYSGMVH